MNSTKIKNINKNIINVILTITLILILDITIRHILEISLVDTKLDYNQLGMNIKDNLLFYYENLSYFILTFLVLSFTIFLITKKNFIDIIKLGSKLYIVVIIPPLLDRFVFNNLPYTQQFLKAGYTYGTSSHFFDNILYFAFKTGDTSYGISTLIILGALTSGIYVFKETKSIFKSLFIIIFLDIFIMIISTPDLILRKGITYFYPELLLTWYFLPIISLLLFMSFYFKIDKNIKKILFFFFLIVLFSNIYYWIVMKYITCLVCGTIYKNLLYIPVLLFLLTLKYFNPIKEKETKILLFLLMCYYMFGYIILYL